MPDSEGYWKDLYMLKDPTSTKSETWLVLNKCQFHSSSFYFFLFKVFSPLFCFLSALAFKKIYIFQSFLHLFYFLSIYFTLLQPSLPLYPYSILIQTQEHTLQRYGFPPLTMHAYQHCTITHKIPTLNVEKALARIIPHNKNL